MPVYKPWGVRSRRYFVGLLLVATLVGCDRSASVPDNTASSPDVAVSPTEPAPNQQDLATKPDAQTAEVYWLDAQANTIELVPAPVETANKDQNSAESSLTSAFEQLMAGPDNSAFVSEIPEGTQLLSVAQNPDGVYVNLSEEFQFGGGSMSMTGRLAQIIYTATSVNPDTQVWLQINGDILEVLGGEGLVLDQPLTRSSFEANFPL